jgi:outer membrane protein OmpA-like peptidoglycan-associated protein
MHRKLSFILLVGLLVAGCCKLNKRSVSGQDIPPGMLTIQYERSAFFKEGLPIYFASGSSAITDEAKERMNNLILMLRGIKHVTIILRGYADRAEYHPLQLSRARVATVKGMLEKSGVVDGSVTIKQEAFGNNDPLISYNTVNNNPLSRRVDVFILGQ